MFELAVLLCLPWTIQAEPADVTAARIYLISTATPGGTMERQGPQVAIGRLHPDFALRLAETIAEARAQGMTEAGIFSAYRPPAFGVGGFADKFDSCHAYGLAADITGIGQAGSKEAKTFHEIARHHKIYGIYGPNSSAEYNHFQYVKQIGCGRIIQLRRTITAQNPIALDTMWETGEGLANGMFNILDSGARKGSISIRTKHRRVKMARSTDKQCARRHRCEQQGHQRIHTSQSRWRSLSRASRNLVVRTRHLAKASTRSHKS